jgi:hypothetical protein
MHVATLARTSPIHSCLRLALHAMVFLVDFARLECRGSSDVARALHGALRVRAAAGARERDSTLVAPGRALALG